MSILIGNTRIWLPHRKSYSPKTSYDSSFPSKYSEKDVELYDPSQVAEPGVSFQIPGPEKHVWTIKEVSHEDEPDVMQLALWKRPFARIIGLTGSVTVILSFYSLYLQVLYLLDLTAQQAISTWTLRNAWIMMGFKLVLSFPTLPLVFVKWKVFRGKFRARYRLLGTDVPFVDVIIPCCKESLDVLQDTITAALALDYPEDRFRVVVTDDGGSSKLRDWIVEQGQPNLFYTSRKKLGTAGFKAGNLNHAIQFIETQLTRGPSEFIASLDADMIPEKKWLRAMIPHLVIDPKLGVVCPTQTFYNFPKDDPICQSQLHAWHCFDFIRDMSGIAWNTGSGFMLRRQALLDIGGFPTDSLTEDVHSSVLMMSKAWKTAYVAESLQYGLMPESFLGHIKQFTRWNLGGIQMAAHFRFYISGAHTGSLNTLQRLYGFSFGLMSLISPIFVTIDMLITPLYLFGGIPMAYFNDLQSMRYLLRMTCISIFMGWLHEANMGVFSSTRLALREAGQGTYMSPYYTIATLRSFILPKNFGGTEPGFTPSGSISASIHERSATRRASLIARLRHILIDCGVWFHFTVILAFTLAVTYRIQSILYDHPIDDQGQRDWHSLAVELIRKVLWPTPGWFMTIFACATPIKYAIFPPNVPDREEMMGERDEKGARYPLPEFKEGKFSNTEFDFGQMYSWVMIPYTLFMFGASWRI